MGKAGLMSCHKRRDADDEEFIVNASRDDGGDGKRQLPVQMALARA